MALRPKRHFNLGVDRNRVTVFHAGFELPFLDCLDRYVIETKADRLHDLWVSDRAIRIDNHAQQNRALEVSLAGFIRKSRRIDLENDRRWCDTASYPEYSSAGGVIGSLYDGTI